MDQNSMNEGRIPTMTRACTGYNPAEHLVEITYQDNGTKAMYLVVKERVRWFNQYCAENGLKGLIDDSDVKFVPTLNGRGHIFASCSVYINGEMIGKSSAACPLTGEYADDKIAVQSAATSAKGRALANAGFDISEVGTPSEDGDSFPCDTGIIISNGRVTGGYVNPMTAWQDERNRAKAGENNGKDDGDDLPFTFGNGTAPAPAPAPVPAPMPAPAPMQGNGTAQQNSQNMTGAPAPQRRRQTQPNRTMTREEALKFVVTTGSYAGKTLGEVMGEDPGRVAWLANVYSGRNADLKLAAQTIIAAQKA